MRPLLVISICLILFGLYIEGANAEPIVILDDGGVSTEPYRRVLQSDEVPDFGGLWVQANLSRIQQDPDNPDVWLPLTTRMTPARIDVEQAVNFNLDAPVCVIGSDPLSLHWIRQNLDKLVQVKARCWLVQARDFQAFSAVSQALQGRVMMTPADGDIVADYFGLSHYPVVIDQRYISQ